MQLLGVRIDNLNIDEALEKIEGFLGEGKILSGFITPPPPSPSASEGQGQPSPSTCATPEASARREGGGEIPPNPPFIKGGEKQYYIVLPYADFLVRAQKDAEFRKILNEADLSLPDGIGPMLASYIAGGEKLQGRVMGVDLIWALFDKFSAEHKFFLFGGREGVAKEAAEKIHQKIPETNIVGTLNGYVSDSEALSMINASGAEILLVALGMPKQEKWIYDNLKNMPSVKLAIGVGGAFDFISGRVRRAPRSIQKMGLEWLWRLFTRPKQWRKTWRSVVIFSWLVLKSTFQHS